MQVKELNSGYRLVQLSKLSQSSKTPIPNTWEVKKLKDIVEINPGVIDVNYSNDKILYIDIGSIERFEIRQYEHFDLDKRPSRAQRIVKKNDIIVSTVRPYLKAFTKISDSKPNLICSTGFAVLGPRNSDDADFIFNYIKSHIFDVNIIRHMEGMAYPAVTSKMVEDSLIPYPTNKNERFKIGSIFLNLNDLIKKTDQVIEQTQRLKKGLMQKLLIKGIGHTNFKKIQVGLGLLSEEIPEEWNISRLDECSTVERGKFTHRPRDDPRFYGGKYPFIQTGDVEKSNGYIRAFSQTLSDQGLSVSKLFPEGIVVMTIAANIGSTAITTFPVCFPDSIVGITPTKLNSRFLEYYLRIRKRSLKMFATVNAQPNINLEILKPLIVPIPPREEQNKIVSILSGIDSSTETDKDYKSYLLKIKKGLMQKLLTGKIRVKV